MFFTIKFNKQLTYFTARIRYCWRIMKSCSFNLLKHILYSHHVSLNNFRTVLLNEVSEIFFINRYIFLKVFENCHSPPLVFNCV